MNYYFWLGRFPSEDDFYSFINENEAYFEDEEGGEYISEFSRTQDEHWLDHDAVECGYETQGNSIREKFGVYSFAEQWADEVQAKASGLNVKEINAIILVNADVQEIGAPVSVRTDDYYLEYLGEISFQDATA